MNLRRVRGANVTRGLVLLLLCAIALLGLTIARQQALGSLHLHKDQRLQAVSPISVAASSLARNWLDRWRQQQRFGHTALRTHVAPDARVLTPSAAQDRGPVSRHDGNVHRHDHGDTERHHHIAGDDSVVAMDGAAEAAELVDAAVSVTSLVLPIAAMPGAGLALRAMAGRRIAWPANRTIAFVSWSVAPPLRPPAR